MSANNDDRQELAAFLRARRAALSPSDVGLPDTNRRRTPGLRREEVAQLSGVGVTWYAWLEQARDIPASGQVLDSLARALRLDEPAHRHLRGLAGLTSPQPDTANSASPQRLQRLLDGLLPSPAYAFETHFDFLAWNRAYTAAWRDPADLPSDRRNLVWAFFTDPGLRTLVIRWETRARALLAQFRAASGRHAGDARFTELIDALQTTSLEFRTWWPRYQVGDYVDPRHAIEHPQAGVITFDLAQLRPVDQPGITVVLQTPRHEADRHALQALLDANVAARPEH